MQTEYRNMWDRVIHTKVK